MDNGMTSPIEFCAEPESRSLGNFNRRDMLVTGKKTGKPSVKDYALFMRPETLELILKGKEVFDHFDLVELENARSRGNPYELIGPSIFMNRAAMKLAEIDACFGWLISEPACWNRNATDPMFFGDLCGGRGGFSEYILWRRGWRTKGFGITLKGKEDIKFDSIIKGHREMFKCFYGPDGDGDITKLGNVIALQEEVLAGTNGSLLHSVVSDGGFSVVGNENEQEILTRELYFYQVLCALMILRKGGNFVCKLFDVCTAFSASLLFLVRLVFRRICLFKPLTSRPANGERYLVCLEKQGPNIVDPVLDYMLNVANRVSSCLRGQRDDVISLIPVHLVARDVAFVDYLERSIERMAQRQIFYLTKLRRFAEDPTLVTAHQDHIRNALLKKWKIPNCGRPAHVSQCGPAELFAKILRSLGSKFLCLSPMYCPARSFHFTFSSKKRFGKGVRYTVSMGELELVIGCGGNRVYSSNVWRYGPEPTAAVWQYCNSGIVLPKSTLLLAEKVEELSFTEKGASKTTCHYILDAFMIGGEVLLFRKNKQIGQEAYLYRHRQIQILLNALHSTPLKLYRLFSWEKASLVLEACSMEIENMIKIGTGLYAPFNGFRTIAAGRQKEAKTNS